MVGTAPATLAATLGGPEGGRPEPGTRGEPTVSPLAEGTKRCRGQSDGRPAAHGARPWITSTSSRPGDLTSSSGRPSRWFRSRCGSVAVARFANRTTPA